LIAVPIFTSFEYNVLVVLMHMNPRELFSNFFSGLIHSRKTSNVFGDARF